MGYLRQAMGGPPYTSNGWATLYKQRVGHLIQAEPAIADLSKQRKRNNVNKGKGSNK